MQDGPSGHDGPHVFVDDLDALVLTELDRHHLARVLRVRPGDPLTVGDGAGRWRPCRFGVRLEPIGDIVEVDPPEPPVTVAFAVLKGGRVELVVQKLTELGVDRIVPIRSERSVVRWDSDQVSRAHERHQRIAREAAMQCRRVRLPVVRPLTEMSEIGAGPGVALADRAGGPPSLDQPTIAVGPEGGFTRDELRERRRVALGSLVLRAETAAIAAGVVLTALRADLVRSAHFPPANHPAR